MKSALLIACFYAAALAQPEHLRVGEIEFFGYAGLDLNAKRAALPVHEGDELSEDQMPGVVARIKQAIQTTSVEAVCCDGKSGLMIYVGLPGESARDLAYHAAPKGSAKFPPAVAELDRRFDEAFSQAMSKGATGEDESKGYALSEDPGLRAVQIAMRDYAVRHDSAIRRVLLSSADAGQRALAARLLGYARQSRVQVAALVRASDDPDAEARNNATRALWVLAASGQKVAAVIPADGFVQMLYSYRWTDRNKAGNLLEALTRDRDAELLRKLHERALGPLLEMARWRDPGHAYMARMILGRYAGIAEARLEKLAYAEDVGPLLDALHVQ